MDSYRTHSESQVIPLIDPNIQYILIGVIVWIAVCALLHYSLPTVSRDIPTEENDILAQWIPDVSSQRKTSTPSGKQHVFYDDIIQNEGSAPVHKWFNGSFEIVDDGSGPKAIVNGTGNDGSGSRTYTNTPFPSSTPLYFLPNPRNLKNG